MEAVNNLSIRNKVLSAFAVVVALLLGTCGLIYGKVRTIEQTTEWASHTTKVLDALAAITAGMVNQETGVRGFLLSGEAGFLAPLRSGRDNFGTAWNSAKQLTADNPAQQVRLDSIAVAAKGWEAGVADKEIALMAKPETVEEARKIESGGAGKTAMDGIRKLVDEASAMEATLMQSRTASQAGAFGATYFFVAAGLGCCTVTAVLMAILLSRLIGQPIRLITTAMGRLATHDTSVIIPAQDRTDEVGRMAAAVQSFKGSMIEADGVAASQAAEQAAKVERAKHLETLNKDFETKAGQMVGLLSSAATELQATAQSMTGTAGLTTQRAEAVAIAADQAGNNVQTVSAAAEELVSSVAEITRQITQTAAASGKAAVEAAQTQATVRLLADNANRIGQVVSLINNIAGQTNLLALNATIEAARAGDAGKGFAVVASEVKALANQTAKATSEIAEQIGQIQAATRDAVAAIEAITATIDQVSQTTSAIAAAVEEQGAATQEIARNIVQASAGTQEVTRNIGEVRHAAEGTSDSASNVLTAAKDLSQQTETFSGSISTFLAGVRAA